MLTDARDNAQRLVDELLRQREQLSNNPQGLDAISEAIAAALETLASLEAALPRD
jgi:hypothetical protein